MNPFEKPLRDSRQDKPAPPHRAASEYAEATEDLATEIKLAVMKNIRQGLDEALHASPQVKAAIRERSLDAPLVETHAMPREIRYRLEQLGYGHAAKFFHPDEQLLIIHLPRNMWPHRQGRVPVALAQNVHELSGALYDRTIEEIWATARTLVSRQGREIHRLNPPGTHVGRNDGYYYLWAICPAGRPPIPWPAEHQERSFASFEESAGPVDGAVTPE